VRPLATLPWDGRWFGALAASLRPSNFDGGGATLDPAGSGHATALPSSVMNCSEDEARAKGYTKAGNCR